MTIHETSSVHILVDIWLNEPDNYFYKPRAEILGGFLSDLFRAHDITVLDQCFHMFEETSENAFTLLFLLAESHASVHTWPEHNFISLDFHFCGNVDHKKFIGELLKGFDINNVEIKVIKRGNK